MALSNPSDQYTPLAPAIAHKLNRPNPKFLREVPLFRGLPESQLKVIDRLIEIRTFAADETILSQGQVNAEIFFVRYGLARVTRTDTEGNEGNTFAYLHENDIFGETGLFSEGDHHATANVISFTEVSVLVMKHSDFINVLNDYHPAALEVARILTQRLHWTSDRLIRDPNDRQFFLVVGVGPGAGATMFGSGLTTAIAHALPNESTVYTEHPKGKELPKLYGINTHRPHYHHDEGYDLYIPFGLPRLVTSLQLNIIWEQLGERYKNIIMTIPSRILEEAGDLLEQVTGVVLVAHPHQWAEVDEMRQIVEDSPYITTNNIMTVANCSAIEDQAIAQADSPFDFTIPHIIELPTVLQTVTQMPDDALQVMTTIRKRLSIENGICVYLPKEATAVRERVLGLFEEHFKGTQIEQESVSTDFVTISGYVDRDALNNNWRAFLNGVSASKDGALDGKIAIEINHHLSLI